MLRRASGIFAGLLGSRGGARELRALTIAQVAPLPLQMLISLGTAFVLLPEARGTAVFVVSGGAIGASLLFGSFHVGAVAAAKAGDRRSLVRAGTSAAGLSVGLIVAGTLVAEFGVAGPGLYTASNTSTILIGIGLYVALLNMSRTCQGLGASLEYGVINIVLVLTYAIGVGIAIGPLGLRNATAVVAPWLFSVIVAVALATILLGRTLHRTVPMRTGSHPNVEAVRSSLVAHAGSVSQQLAYRADLFLLGIFATAATVGVYTLSVSLAELVWVIPEIIALSVFADDDVRSGKEWRAALERRIRSVFVVTAGAAALTLAGAALLLLVFVPDYRTGLIYLAILLPGMVLTAGGRVILSALTARDQRRQLTIASVVTVVASLAYIPGIMYFDALGAAVVSTGIYVIQWLCLRRLMRTVT